MRNTCKVSLSMCGIQGTFTFLFLFMTEVKLRLIFKSIFVFCLAQPYETRILPYCTIC